MTEGFDDFFLQYTDQWKWRTAHDYRNRTLIGLLEELKKQR